MICGLMHHYSPRELGSTKRIYNILGKSSNLLQEKATLYVLSESHLKTNRNKVKVKGIRKPLNINSRYFLPFPFLLRNNIGELQKEVSSSHLIFFEMPYMAYLALNNIVFPESSLKIYDAHNFEYKFAYDRFQTSKFAFLSPFIAEKTRKIEKQVIQNSDFIFATSRKEKIKFNKVYDFPQKKIIIVPNGVNVDKVHPLKGSIKREVRRKFRLQREKKIVIFLGAKASHNVEAAKWLMRNVIRNFPDVLFLFVGSICEKLPEKRKNIKQLGYLPEKQKNLLLGISDIGVNPVKYGAGTNVKMIEYLAAGLPVIATPKGARGIEKNALIVSSRKGFNIKLKSLLDNVKLRKELSKKSRNIAVKKYSWKRIVKNSLKEISLL